MHETGALPREDDAIARAPEQLVARNHGVKRASRSWRCFPQLAALAGLDVGNADGPRFGRSHWTERERARDHRNANEGYTLAIGGPCRLRIAIRAGVQITQRLRGEIVHADE